MKKILGLDLGTNSIGWSLIEIDHEKGIVKIIGLGSRILPMDAGEINDFESKGKIKSTAAQRTEKRGLRRLNERYILRRDRLHLVLHLLNTLPEHYKLEIDFTNKKGQKCGQYKTNKEPKLAYLPKQKGEKAKFLFMDSYKEMLDDINEISIENVKGKRIPYDWTLYYLRNKALSKQITLEEFAWVLLSYNQKRGYEKTEVEDKSTKENEIVEKLDLQVKEVIPQVDEEGKQFYKVYLDGNDNFVYSEYADIQITFNDDIKEIIKTSKVDELGNIDDRKTEFTVVDIYPLEIKDVQYEKDDGKHKYTLTYQNGWQEIKQSNNFTFRYKNALGKSFDYIIETVYDSKGELKKQQGKERKLREPDLSDTSSDWTLLKKKTEKVALTFNIEQGYKNTDDSAKSYISPKIYDVLKSDAKMGSRTKVIGGMFQVVDRDFYREELNQIIATQKQFHKSLEDKQVFEQCVKTLYPKNKNYQETLLKNKDAIQHLLVEDVLLYQRPLKNKKSEIANCKYEIRYWKDVVDKKTDEILKKVEPVYIKVISASHPYFQEFRIWDKLHNLRLIAIENVNKETGEISTNIDATKEYIKNEDDYQKLFQKLNNQKSLNQEQFLGFCKDEFGLPYDKRAKNFVWNFPDDEELKGNETRVSFATRFKRCGFTEYGDFLTQEKERELWHYLYSVNYIERRAKDHKTDEANKSITTFFNNYFGGFEIDKSVKKKIIYDFLNYPKFASRYCAYSEKALKKLIPKIQKGSKDRNYSWESEDWYVKWDKSNGIRKEEILRRKAKIDFTRDEIEWDKFTDTEAEVPFPKGLFNTFRKFEKVEDFTNLNLTQASYLVYGRHTELAFAKQWGSPKQIRDELHQELKQHSLNNPIAEKVLLEMTQVVADIWEFYGTQKTDADYEKGEGYEKLFDRIHLEVGRELKRSSKEKESESKRMSENRAQNKRIRQVLEEFLANAQYNANPKNHDHFERLKIVEEGAEYRKNVDKEFFKDKSYIKNDIEAILKKEHITKSDFEKYKLWIEQGYHSPYSGQPIKITELFDGVKYNIDHIFPQASITNDSLSNKVVVEVELNKLKSNKTARAFIQSQNGHSHLGIPVCSEDDFVSIVKTQFSGTKRFILLSKDIPKGFTNSHMNNARHIARKAMELLSHIVREPGEVEFRSKNVLPVTGKVTTELKRAWKLDQVWTELVSPRFIRLNGLTQSSLFGSWQKSKSGKDYFDCNLDDSIREKDESYNIKRIDHRHHALDALIVALCTEEHVNYFNNINGNAKSRDYGKQKQIEKYRQTLKRKIKFAKRDDENDDKNWYFMLPGEKRQDNAEDSRRNSVIEMSYHYKEFDFFNSDYKRMILTALQQTVTTFKQNLRVINKTVNRYNNTPNKKKIEKQKGNDVGNKTNWAIRRSLGEDTYYGKVYLGDTENRQLYKCLDLIYSSPELIVDNELLTKILETRKKSNKLSEFEALIKNDFTNIKVELKSYKIVVRKSLVYTKDNQFNKDKLSTITDTGIQKILLNHLRQFDTVELPFDNAIKYFDSLVEKHEFEAIVNDGESDFQSINSFIDHLKENKHKYNKTDYSKVNVFIDKVKERDFRSEKQFEDKIDEHPEIAFTPEAIEEMNKPENLQKLNGGKNHAPIRKVRITRGFGNQRALSENQELVKSKQYVVNDAGSNLYLGFYERGYRDDEGNEVRERKFKDISLMELIEALKQDKNNRYHPLPGKIYDNSQNEYYRKFTLSPLDLVYVPTDEEMENPSQVDFSCLTSEQIDRVYKYIDGGFNSKGVLQTNFIPFRFSKVINLKDLKIGDKKFNGEITLTTDKPKQQKTLEGYHQNLNDKVMIREICWKLNVDRLGNIISSKQPNYPYNNPGDENRVLNEPMTAYKTEKKIQISKSLEDSENFQLSYWAVQNPNQRFRDFAELMDRFYEFVTPNWKGKKIILDL